MFRLLCNLPLAFGFLPTKHLNQTPFPKPSHFTTPKMAKPPYPPLLPILFLSLTSMIPSSCSNPQHHCATAAVPQVRAAFWSSHSYSYSPLSHINTAHFTHIYYSSLSLDTSTMQVAPPHPDELPVFANFSSTLRTRDAAIKTMISISSIDQQLNMSNVFSSMAAISANRVAFIESSVRLARQNSFDGLDLAWQFPSSSVDMSNLALLLREWKTRVNQEANETRMPVLLLTATVYFSGHVFDAASNDIDYPIQTISECLDWINTLSFGYHSDGNVTAADAALFDIASHLSTSYGVNSWLDAGLSPCKLVMGIPLYGRSWFLKNKQKYNLGAQTVAKGPKRKLSNQIGIMAYFEIEKFFSSPRTEFEYDNRTVSAYFHDGNIWVSFDSTRVVEKKLAYAKKKELLGYFLWPVSFDTSNNSISQLAADLWEVNPTGGAQINNNRTENSHPPIYLPQHGNGSDRSASTFSSRAFLTLTIYDHTLLLYSCIIMIIM